MSLFSATNTHIRFPALIFSILIILALLGCKESQSISESTPKVWQVPVTDALKENLSQDYVAVGSVIADRRIDISSRISGYIRKLDVQEGDTVQDGQLLVLLDDQDLQNSTRQAQASVDAAEATLKDIEADLTRFDRLLQQGSIAATKVRKTRLQYDTAKESLRSAQAALASAIAQRQYIQIRSPATGIVTTRHKQAGSLATPGTPLLTIASHNNLRFETYVAESQLENIHIDDLVKLTIDNVADPIEGKVAHIVYASDPVTRSYKVTIDLPAQASIHPGMFGRASFAGGKSAKVTVPLDALVERGGLRGVYIVDEKNTARFRWLRIRRQWQGKAEISAGLELGEQFVARAVAGLAEGDLITPQRRLANE